MRTGCQGDNREQENAGLSGPFPFSHPSPKKLTVPRVIAADNTVGGDPVLFSSLKNGRSLLFSFFHSSTAMTPFRAWLEQDMVYFLWYFQLLTPEMVSIDHLHILQNLIYFVLYVNICH